MSRLSLPIAIVLCLLIVVLATAIAPLLAEAILSMPVP